MDTTLKFNMLGRALLFAPLGLWSVGRISVASASPPWPWTLMGNAAASYAMESSGHPLDTAGANVSIHSTAAVADEKFGAAGQWVTPDGLRGKRVTLSGEIRTAEVKGGASLWMRFDHDSEMLWLDNGGATALRGSEEWTRRNVSFVVPDKATAIWVGMIVRGSGSAQVRNLKLQVDPLPK